MAEGLAAAEANAILDALCRGVAWTPPTQVWVRLHVGPPGASGTANRAVESTRIRATFAAAPAAGRIVNTSSLTWPSVAGEERYTYWSAWADNSDSRFVFSGAVNARDGVLVGDIFVVEAGELVVSLPVAS